jgi:hypothetical protein
MVLWKNLNLGSGSCKGRLSILSEAKMWSQVLVVASRLRAHSTQIAKIMIQHESDHIQEPFAHEEAQVVGL